MMDKLLPYTGFWRRLAAMLLDFLVLYGCWELLNVSRPMMMYFFRGHVAQNFTLLEFLYVIYNIYCHGRWGQTPGKLIMQIRVIKLSGDAMTFRESYRRFAVDVCCVVVKSFWYPVFVWYINTFEPDMSTSESNKIFDYFKPLIYVELAWHLWILSEPIVLLFNEKKRAAHDFIAGTVVVYEKDKNILGSFSAFLEWIRSLGRD